MPSLKDLYDSGVPANGKANVKGVDYTPIGDESSRPEYNPSQDFVNQDLTKQRGGALGSGKYQGGYTNNKTYSSTNPK